MVTCPGQRQHSRVTSTLKSSGAVLGVSLLDALTIFVQMKRLSPLSLSCERPRANEIESNKEYACNDNEERAISRC